MVFAFTDEGRHQQADIDVSIGWTARTTHRELWEFAIASGFDGIALDPGCDPAILTTQDPGKPEEP